MIKKPENFTDLLELQKKLDETVSKERGNGFIPRKRDFIDVYLSFDDEVNEWAKELPDEYNFKTWKEKEYSREKEIIEFVDTLFFILQYINFDFDVNDTDEVKYMYELWTSQRDRVKKTKSLKEEILTYKTNFKNGYLGNIFLSFWRIAELRNFAEKEIIDIYWEKWNTNMKRINKDWSITSQN